MTSENSKRPVIAVVEDDLPVSLMLTRQLERAGWAVITAASVSEARTLLASVSWDVALLDRHLPDGDGIELCRELRIASPHAYLMMLTGDDSEAAKLAGFDRGVDDYMIKPVAMPELLARIRAGLRIVALQKQLIELSLSDGLTGLRNRRAFDEALPAQFELARRYQRPLSLAIIDVDHFKIMNDTFGHQAGDRVLRDVGGILESTTRRVDFVARVGGEEFAILLPETALFEALLFGEKIRANVAAVDRPHRVTISIGVASMPHSEVNTANELLYAADQALYRAKNRGRNRVECERRRLRYARAGERTAASSQFSAMQV